MLKHELNLWGKSRTPRYTVQNMCDNKMPLVVRDYLCCEENCKLSLF